MYYNKYNKIKLRGKKMNDVILGCLLGFICVNLYYVINGFIKKAIFNNKKCKICNNKIDMEKGQIMVNKKHCYCLECFLKGLDKK
jgi:hypothetical protein